MEYVFRLLQKMIKDIFIIAQCGYGRHRQKALNPIKSSGRV